MRAAPLKAKPALEARQKLRSEPSLQFFGSPKDPYCAPFCLCALAEAKQGLLSSTTVWPTQWLFLSQAGVHVQDQCLPWARS
mmetsp:Transcript_50577/g.90788  ORF Transcript_50577/g.90788 Transcript_50577/m.90788 type:complete len:82 (+) Transcript_50577:304-549(+)